MGCTNSKLNVSEPSQSVSGELLETKAINFVPTKQIERRYFVQNLVVVWLDPSLDRFSEDVQNSVMHFREFANSTEIFTDLEKCATFIREVKNEKVFLIVSARLGQQLVSAFYSLPQVYSIYVVCDDKTEHQQWIEQYHKVKDIFMEITPIFSRLKRDTKEVEQNLSPISILGSIDISSDIELNQLDPSFMYSKLLKEIIIDMDFDKTVKSTFVDFCRVQYQGNVLVLKVIDDFEKNKEKRSPIWWYTSPTFLYTMLNRALRLQDTEIIWKMGFFIKDLHQQIEQLHAASTSGTKFVVYRGQGMTHEEFSKLRQHIGGLFSFNSFISTSTDKLLSLAFAYGTLGNPDMTAIFFEMEIDPSIQSSPFASIESLSYFPAEHEMLFSMHSVFRIEDVKQIQDGIWQVNLRLTSDDDEQLRRLYQFIHKEMRNIEGVERLAKLMSEMGEWEKATKIYEALIRTTNDDDKKKLAHLHGQLGFICNEQSDWHQALFHGEKALELYLTFLPPDHPQIATIYTNIGFTLREKGELESSLNYHYRGLDIKRKALEPDKQEIAISYGNIGEVLRKQGRLDEALTSFQQCLTNELECLPTTHPSLAFTYSSIGLTYNDKGDHTNALSQYEQCLMIQKKSLPPNHPFVAATYANMAKACQSLHRYDDALQYAEKAVSIASHNFSPDHPELVHYQAMLDKIHHKL